MKIDEIIVDADFCIKVGASAKYRYLERVLPALADKVYIHKTAYDEVIIPASAKEQLDSLKTQGVLEVLDENGLNPFEKSLYQDTYNSLADVMISPNNPRKNRGETCSLAMAKTRSIPYFVTDERNLQPIIDWKLNTGMNDIMCVRIEDVIKRIKSGELEGFSRSEAKIMWRLSGKDTSIFDSRIWPKPE